MRSIICLWVFSVAACGVETEGERVHVRWEVDQGSQAENADFETTTGYTVHLDEARVELKGVYLYAPASATQKAVAWFERGMVSVAYAHGGVDVEKGRRVLAEWTKPMNIDVLSDASMKLLETDAEGGTIDAVKIEFVDNAVAHVRGHAERDGKRWLFEGDIDPKKNVQRLVELLELDESLTEGSVVRLAVHPKTWLSLCEFSELGAPQDQGASDSVFMPISKDDQVGRAIDIGVRSPNAFEVEIVSGKGAS
jgi:hypothetical protein